MLRGKWIVAVLVVAMLAGCQGKRKSQKEEANEQWNAARASVMYGLARGQYETGNFERARKTVEEGLALDPRSVPLHVLSARLAIEMGQLELAEKELRLVREIDPRNAEADYMSGVIYQRWQQPERAHDFYASAGQKAPAELAYVMAQAEMLVHMDRTAEALVLLQARVVYFEHSPAIRDAVGQLLMQESRYSEAIDMFRQASILGAEDLTYREHLGLALYFARQWRESADVLGRLLRDEEYANRSDLHLALGECQLAMGRVRDARSTFERASQLDGGSVSVWLSLGKVALQLNDPRRAEISLRKALALDDSSSDAWLMMGYLRLREEKWNDALVAFRRSFDLDRSDAVSLCMIGYVLEKMGQPERAMQQYAQALRLKPNDELAMTLMSGLE
jgi:Tfp pilus assembly protein PilF